MMTRFNLSTVLAAAALAAVLQPTGLHAEHKLLVAEFPATSHQGYLGVALHDVSDDRAAQLKLKDARGVEVTMLDHDGPACKAGVREHDVILQLNGQDVASEEQLRRMLRETPAGRKADLLLSRDGEQMKLQVVLGDRATSVSENLGQMPDLGRDLDRQLATVANGLRNMPIPDGDPFLGGDFEVFEGNDLPAGKMFFFASSGGAQVEALGPQLAKYFGAGDGKGLLVKAVQPDTAAAKAGLKAGDVIVKAAGKPIATRTDWEQTLRANTGKQLDVELLRDKHQQKLTMTVAANTQGSLLPQDWPTLEKQLHAQLEAQQWQQQLANVRAEAEKAAAEWKQQQPQIEEQLRKAAEQASHAAQEHGLQFHTMD